MPVAWKHTTEQQRRKFSLLVEYFMLSLAQILQFLLGHLTISRRLCFLGVWSWTTSQASIFVFCGKAWRLWLLQFIGRGWQQGGGEGQRDGRSHSKRISSCGKGRWAPGYIRHICVKTKERDSGLSGEPMQHEHPDESASAHDKIHCAIARSKNYACTRCEIEARESSALWFLNIEVRDDQIEILNPKQRDV